MSSVLAPAATPPAAEPVPWSSRAYASLSAYLPLMLMALLAAATWWLVKNTPVPATDRPAVALRHDADYTMHRFTVQRFTPEGRLRVQIEGDAMRHFPDTDTVEIDDVHLLAYSPDDGGKITALARHATANGDATQVQLQGGAHVVRETPGEAPIVFDGEFLQVYTDTERLHSHLPVVVRQGNAEMRGDSFDYDNLTRIVRMQGRVHVTLNPQSGAAARTTPP